MCQVPLSPFGAYEGDEFISLSDSPIFRYSSAIYYDSSVFLQVKGDVSVMQGFHFHLTVIALCIEFHLLLYLFIYLFTNLFISSFIYSFMCSFVGVFSHFFTERVEEAYIDSR